MLFHRTRRRAVGRIIYSFGGRLRRRRSYRPGPDYPTAPPSIDFCVRIALYRHRDDLPHQTYRVPH